MVEGRCNCGQIKVSIPAIPDQSAICFCSNCRRAGSCAGSILFPVDKPDVTIHDAGGNLKTYKDTDTKSGNTVTRKFCGICGCPVASFLGEEFPKVFVKAGLFEEFPVPGYKSFEHEKPGWLSIAES
ncbi:hypothetical protein ACJQWK_10166 [Exserohilum turcicum]|uniref:CENP-V/GFA domain-containing protein n=1 Tax=Exserohilum turcicum (strain 28A) TaxID=671987 RepID=R0KCZ8_EXST2|nr:uncharacterized protein SETTUDRAFT_163239 [Exserohilum turcica Et28A]EOA87244.1 hypothetical protein SETTUDRAFT_163239 [Exserohilum turcica Et28A]